MQRQNDAQNLQTESGRKMPARNNRSTGFIDDRNAVALRFADRETSNQAVGIILKNAPDHAFLFPDPLTIIMNKEDQPLFDGLKYEPEDVATPEEVSAAELAELRHQHLYRNE